MKRASIKKVPEIAWQWALLACLLALVTFWVRNSSYSYASFHNTGKNRYHRREKPVHCRPELPGCVPKVIDYLYFLHVPKTAGSSLTVFISMNSQRSNHLPGFDRFHSVTCNLIEHGMGSYSCHGRRSWLRDAAIMSSMCTMQAEAVSRQWFDEQSCNSIFGHYDMTVYESMKPSIRERTLVIFTMREPVDLLISLYNYLSPLSPGGKHFLEDVKGELNVTLTGFAQGESGLGIDLQDGAMTKMLAGDYCCYNRKAPISSPEARLDAAYKALDTQVGVVLLREKFEDSKRYLAYVLGWPNTDSKIRANVNPHSTNVSLAERRALENGVPSDLKLYKRVQEIFRDQMAVLNSSPFPVLPRWYSE